MEHTGAYLVLRREPSLGKRIELWKDCTTIGRSRDCDIFLEDITVHRRQASIIRTQEGYVLRDDHGSGDSFVNGQAIKERVLNSGDQLLFGNTQLTFYANEGTRPFQLPSSRGRESYIVKAAEPGAKGVAPHLELMRNQGGVQAIELLPEMTIGRSRECSIFLEDLAVSRVHATIRELPSGQYELRDNRSATGTLVNQRPVTRRTLQEGDVIQIGSHVFIYRGSGS